MILPTAYMHFSEWALVGPMGPTVPEFLQKFPLLGVDGGAMNAAKLDLWAGDSDSLKSDIKALHAFHLPVDKDLSDLGAALSLFTRPCPMALHLWGFLGGRKDHELFNLGEVLNWLKERRISRALFYDSGQKISFELLSPGAWALSYHGTFSIGSHQNLNLTLKGNIRYPLPGPRAIGPLSSLGLSNVAEGPFTIDTDGPLFIYYPEGR